jgi:preprotein translocase subunit SecE
MKDVSQVRKKAGAVKKNKNISSEMVKEQPDLGKDEHPAETRAQQGRLRSILRLVKRGETKAGEEKAPVGQQEARKTPARGKGAGPKEGRSPRTREGKERPKKSFFRDAAKFFQSVWGELKKVHWPTRSETAAYTVVVISSVVIVALLILVADTILSKLVELLLQL